MGNIPEDPEELALVRKAILLHKDCPECLRWNDEAGRRLIQSGFCFHPKQIQKLLYEHVFQDSSALKQVSEKREFNRRYYYKAIVPVSTFARGLFVELVLMDRDEDYPMVEIVNAHEQR